MEETDDLLKDFLCNVLYYRSDRLYPYTYNTHTHTKREGHYYLV